MIAISQVSVHLCEDNVDHLSEGSFRGVSVDCRVRKEVDSVLGVYGVPKG